MNRSYDLCEVLSDGKLVWRDTVEGLDAARSRLRELAARTTNECIVLHTPTQTVLGRANVPGPRRRVLQIAYDEALLITRAELLGSRGYEVVSVLGNEAAKQLLSGGGAFDLFVVGHAAPDPEREAMVQWLKSAYPGVKILALNPPHFPLLRAADFNVTLNGPEAWLTLVATALAGPLGG